MALPDFIIIGAMKCGTTTIAAQLNAQPGIFMAAPKEPNFFSDDAIFAKGQHWYEDLFAGAKKSDLKGEASTHYSKSPTYPECFSRFSAALTAPKIIYLIRDPVERAISHYIHEWSMGNIVDDLSTAFEKNSELVSYGCYGDQIAPFFKTYGKDSIHLMSFEQLENDPQAALEGVCKFVGYTGTPIWRSAHLRENESSTRIRKFPLHKLVVDNPVAAALRRSLIPQHIRDKIRRARQMQVRPALPNDLREKMQKIFFDDYIHLRALFPEARHLDANYPFLEKLGLDAPKVMYR